MNLTNRSQMRQSAQPTGRRSPSIGSAKAPRSSWSRARSTTAPRPRRWPQALQPAASPCSTTTAAAAATAATRAILDRARDRGPRRADRRGGRLGRSVRLLLRRRARPPRRGHGLPIDRLGCCMSRPSWSTRAGRARGRPRRPARRARRGRPARRRGRALPERGHRPPPEVVAQMRNAPFRPGLEAIAPHARLRRADHRRSHVAAS